MSISSIQPIPYGGISPIGKVPPVNPVSPAPQVTGLVHQTDGTITTTGTKFTPSPDFDRWMISNLVRGAVRSLSLAERRRSFSQKRADPSRRANDGATDEAVDSVSGRGHALDVAFALNLLREDSGDDQRSLVEEELKARKLDRKDRLHVYIKAHEHAAEAGLSPEDTGRVKQALKKSQQDLQSQNRHELRQAIHDREKLREAIEAIAGPIENLKAGMRRELRFSLGQDRPHTEMHRVDVPFQALSMLKFMIEVAGPEGCKKALAAIRGLWRSGY
jgi:hypothetical protein